MGCTEFRNCATYSLQSFHYCIHRVAPIYAQSQIVVLDSLQPQTLIEAFAEAVYFSGLNEVFLWLPSHNGYFSLCPQLQRKYDFPFTTSSFVKFLLRMFIFTPDIFHLSIGLINSHQVKRLVA